MDLTSRSRRRRLSASGAQQEVVELAEAYLRAHLGTPMRLSRLCRMVGLSERGLRNAFYSVRGMSPKRCMLAERLRGVRKALRDSGASPMTVTDAATGYGFYELGRFAAVYRQAFGEAPSETLRCSGRRSATEQRRQEGQNHASAS